MVSVKWLMITDKPFKEEIEVLIMKSLTEAGVWWTFRDSA